MLRFGTATPGMFRRTVFHCQSSDGSRYLATTSSAGSPAAQDERKLPATMFAGVIIAVGASSAASHTTPSLPACHVSEARPHWAIIVSTAPWFDARSTTWSHDRPWTPHQAPQAFSASSSMREAGRPAPAATFPAIVTPRAYHLNIQAGLEVFFGADHAPAPGAAPSVVSGSQTGTSWEARRLNLSRRPDSWPDARIFMPMRLRPA